MYCSENHLEGTEHSLPSVLLPLFHSSYSRLRNHTRPVPYGILAHHVLHQVSFILYSAADASARTFELQEEQKSQIVSNLLHN